MKSSAQHPVTARLSSVGGSLRRITLLAVLLRMLTLSIVAIVVIGLIDYGVRIEDRGLRVMATGLVWGVIGYGILQFVNAVRSSRSTAVAVAQRVERHFPAVGDRLSSAVAFLAQDEDDPLAGSAALRRSVISEAADDVAVLPLMRAVDRTQLTRAARSFAVGLIALVGLVALGGDSVSIAARRLANPFGELDWPRTHHLEFVNPLDQMAAGGRFEARLVDRGGVLPDDVLIHYRYRRGRGWAEESLPMRPFEASMIAVRDNVRETFEFRASGGDDDSMQWHHVRVIDPPKLASLAITIHPPSYTGYLAYQAERPMHVLAGSGIELRGVATAALSAAAAVLEDGTRVPADLAADRQTFTIPPDRWRAEVTMPYRWDLANADGFAATEERELLRVVDDPPPTVAFELPAAQEFVTPQATLPLKLIIKDNLAVQRVELVIRRTPETADDAARLEVYRQDAPPQSARGQSPLADDGQRLIVEQMWELAPLGLAPGDKLSVDVVAADFRPGESRTGSPRIIHVISPVELQQRLAGQQDYILSQLAQAVEHLRTAREDTRSLSLELEQEADLPTDFLQQTQAIELMHRGVDAALVDPAEGLLAEIRRLLGEVERNQADAPELQMRMKDLEVELQRLAGGPLAEVRQNLTAAMKSARGDRAPRDELAASLARTTAQQTEVIDTLQAKLGDLAQWAGFKQFARDIMKLQLDQQQLAETTREVGLDMLAADPQQTLPENEAAKRIARTQTALARRMEVAARRMQEMVATVADDEPVAAETLADALHRSRQLGIAQAMRQAAQQVNEGQIGQALRNQDQAAKDLQEVLDTLRNRREHELDRLLEKIVEAEQDLAELAEQVGGHRQELDQATPPREPDLERLTREAEQLEASLERMARRLERLDAEQAARSTTRAAQRLQQAPPSTAEGNRVHPRQPSVGPAGPPGRAGRTRSRASSPGVGREASSRRAAVGRAATRRTQNHADRFTRQPTAGGRGHPPL